MSDIQRYDFVTEYQGNNIVNHKIVERPGGTYVRYEDALFWFAERVCPCVIASEPCSPVCSCVVYMSSAGCKCCTHYGSKEQRKASAEQIVQSMVEFDAADDPVGWTIVAAGDDGSVLCRAPNGRRARFWFGAKNE